MTQQEKQRLSQIAKNIPELFNFGGGKELLYIGASPSRFQFGRELQQCGYAITILEAWHENYKHYLDKGYNIILGDVSATNTIMGSSFDVTFWWHGPEHINREQLPLVLKEIELITSDLIVLGCPWGKYEQGAVGGNIWEKHLSTLDKDFFDELGYNTNTVGEKDVPNKNNLLAWKEINES